MNTTAAASTPRLTDTELDACYTQFCHQMTAVGEAQAPLFMARFALLAMSRIGDAAAVQQFTEQAAQDLLATQAA